MWSLEFSTMTPPKVNVEIFFFPTNDSHIGRGISPLPHTIITNIILKLIIDLNVKAKIIQLLEEIYEL